MFRDERMLSSQQGISVQQYNILINPKQRLIMEEKADNYFEYKNERCAECIKIAIIKDSQFFMIKGLLYPYDDMQILRYFSRQLQRVYLEPGKDIDDSQLKNVFYPTCLITNRAIFKKYEYLIMKRFYICHVIIIEDIQRKTGTKTDLNYKTIIINPKEHFSWLELECADNFFLNKSKESQQFRKFVGNLCLTKSEYKKSKKLFKDQYLKLIGHSKSSRKAFDLKYFHEMQNGNILRIYSQVNQIYQINIILRRFHEQQILSYIKFVVHLIFKSIQENPIKKFRSFTRYYRGAQISQKEALAMQSHLNHKQRQPILCRSFMSCSLDYNIADHFRGNCIFQIHVQSNPEGFVSLDKSVYKDEQQILFNVFSKFLIKLVKQDKTRGDKGWYIVLSYVGQSKFDQI